MLRLAAALFASMLLAVPAWAGDGSKCPVASLVLWGDGRHDDTRALNAWFRGDPVIWAQTGQPAGPQIADRSFLMTSAVYVPSGTGRRLERFRMIWPARKEVVSGGTIVAGNDADKPPLAIGITKTGAGPDEGVPFPAPKPQPADRDSRTDCLIS